MIAPYDRVILHCDANSFYASVSLTKHPQYKGKPLSVGGDPEQRHGIILASTPEAKRFGVKTGMPLWQAKKACPQLTILPPDFQSYMDHSDYLRTMYYEYTPQVESYGLDECWLDYSGPRTTIADGIKLADLLRRRVRNELGITLSIGVSYNKIFAKLGSDYKKPDATTPITRQNYKQIAWPLPVGDLLFVGPQTTKKLNQIGITTIGQLANAPDNTMHTKFGKVGAMLLSYARGDDLSPVMYFDQSVAVKSVGNSATLPHDITNIDEFKSALYMLAESVAARLRGHALKGDCVSIHVRQTDLNVSAGQKKLPNPAFLSGDIANGALEIYAAKNFARYLPLRSMGVAISNLVPINAPEQLDLLNPVKTKEKEIKLAKALDRIRHRYGHNTVQRAVVLADPAFAKINPKEDLQSNIHPVPFFTG